MLMLITVGSESTMEVEADDIARFLSTLRKYPQKHDLTEIMEWFETLLELIDAETD